MRESLADVLREARACRVCEAYLPLGPNPIVRATERTRVVLVSQAPGTIAHRKSVPYRDPSGVRLREWLGVGEEAFYESGHFGILPMGFCYPGKAGGGDAPPRPECAPLWHDRLLAAMPSGTLKVLIGAFAQRAYLGDRAAKTLTQTVRRYADYLPEYFPLPHPSPRNNMFLRRNPWIEGEVLPELRRRVAAARFGERPQP